MAFRFAIALVFLSATALGAEFAGKVVSVTDGDTIKVLE